VSRADGGRLDAGLADAVRSHTAGGTDVTVELGPPTGVLELADQLESGATSLTPVDVLLLSLEPDLQRDASDLSAGLSRVMAVARPAGTRLLVLNGSTVVPDPPGPPTSLAIHRLDLELLQSSVDEGLSIVDADRVLAESGADHHVEAPLRYSAAACSALRDEVVRILEDYGYFDERPLLEQAGRAAR
jgi:hypothetical protein